MEKRFCGPFSHSTRHTLHSHNGKGGRLKGRRERKRGERKSGFSDKERPCDVLRKRKMKRRRKRSGMNEGRQVEEVKSCVVRRGRFD